MYAPYYGIARLEALAYNRFRWHGVPSKVGDVERILTYTGVSIPVEREGDPDSVDRTALPAIVPLELLEPFRAVEVAPLGGEPDDNGLYPWDRLITVACARQILFNLSQTMAQLDDAQIKAAMFAKMRKAVRTTKDTAADASEIVNGAYGGMIPIFKASGGLTGDDIITISDGETHAQSLNELHTVALARACQELGIRFDAVIKKERLVTDEVGISNDMVDIVREREIEQRRKLAEWTGWELEVLV